MYIQQPTYPIIHLITTAITRTGGDPLQSFQLVFTGVITGITIIDITEDTDIDQFMFIIIIITITTIGTKEIPRIR